MNHRLDEPKTAIAVPSALSPKTWPFSLEWLPSSACLVGGTVRDALLGRHSEYLDLDFVLPVGSVETAQAIARHYKAGFVLLDADRQIARVVFRQGTADFAQQVGSSLEADLRRRDFTVNAIAYNPHTDQILDPLHGYADLQKHVIRMVSAENLREDPLRLLRAYRQAAQLSFSLETDTRALVPQLAPLLSRIAAERVQSELNYLLSTFKGTAWLTAAWQDCLLKDWFPDAMAESLNRVAVIDQAAARIHETLPAFASQLASRLRSSTKATESAQPIDTSASGSARSWLTVAKLASLLPITPARAELQLRHLKYSRTEIQAVSTVLKFLPSLCAAVQVSGSGHPTIALSLREQFRFFQDVGATFPAVAVLAIASGVPFEAIVPLMHRFLTPDDPVAHPTPLLTGKDLMVALRIPAGPHIGYLLSEIQLARAEGSITSATEALQLARVLSAENPTLRSSK
ncbi:CCA tRNA nucleotidyltransferase [Leptolyngbya sp. FACHB-36]|uniref:CCA tRNA nucleotidyltransferase n=1 Tax=Leptolyngbya sp. FACHB-36 TaxID=2692808 RepID=UPI001F55692C|nr:CCA tRNA nucleotidyltransferase [Leptolyngbya sp. FACHB-36]